VKPDDTHSRNEPGPLPSEPPPASLYPTPIGGAGDDAAPRRRRSGAHALLFAMIVLVAGGAFGVAGFFIEQAKSDWRPPVARTATGWHIGELDRPGLAGISGLALDGGRIAWRDGRLVLLMDLRSGKPKLLGPGPLAQAAWDPAISQRYVVWFEAAASSANEASAWAYDPATRRRLQIASLNGVDSPPTASGKRAVWCTGARSGGPVILGVDISTGKGFVVSRENGEPVMDGNVVAWASQPGRTGMPAVWALVDLAQGRRWSIVPTAPLSNAHLVGYDLSGRTLVWGEVDPRGGRSRIVAQNIDDGGSSVVADVTGAAARAFAPSIDGDLVVWAEAQSADSGRVMGRRLGGGPAFVVNDVHGSVLDTAVSGDTVAWLARDGQTSFIETTRVSR
jgi:hypothetical protein